MAAGTNTAASTSEIAMMGLVIWSMALRVASLGDRCSSRISRSTDSMTTMASSTTIPMASTMPNNVSWLIENPKICMPMNAPMSATGTTSVGISVARKLCRNTSMTMNTRTTAATRVKMTSSMACVMKVVASSATNHSTPGGNSRCNSFIRALTASATWSAFAPGNSVTPKPLTGWSSSRTSKP
jgi:hypothetical protein